jgi:1,4-dihydroxy-2-naphthoate octaprenyltransferase
MSVASSVPPPPSPLRAWLLATRPKTLPAAVAPVALASALAFEEGVFALLPAILCLLFALLIQIGTNFANDYFDFVKGADTKERIGPARAVAAGWIAPQTMFRGMLVTFALAFLSGLLLVPYGGLWLVAIGILSILCGIAYTGGPYPLGYNGWGDVFVFVFFGLIATGFTYFVQAGAFSPLAWTLGIIPGALASNILVVNNLRDVATDRTAGKRTLVVRLGVRFGEWQYRLSWLLCFVLTLYLSWQAQSLFPLLPWLLFFWAWKLSILLERSQGRGPRRWLFLLSSTAKFMSAFSLLLVIGLLLA